MQQDLRAFLAQLPPEERCVLEGEPDDYLLTALVEELEKGRRFPVVELRHPAGGRTEARSVPAGRRHLQRGDGAGAGQGPGSACGGGTGPRLCPERCGGGG